jgi:dihydrofolate reductase
MQTLIYSMSVSLDGYIAGPDGAIDWAAPDEELMRFHNEQTRELAGHLSGRRLYEDMLVRADLVGPPGPRVRPALDGHPESRVLKQPDDGGR